MISYYFLRAFFYFFRNISILNPEGFLVPSNSLVMTFYYCHTLHDHVAAYCHHVSSRESNVVNHYINRFITADEKLNIFALYILSVLDHHI